MSVNKQLAKIHHIETERLKLQARLNTEKSQEERNKLGQFATPPKLAMDIMEVSKGLIGFSEGIRFLDPAFGTGSFYAALLKCFSHSHLNWAQGYEIDPHYGNETVKLWNDTKLELRIVDFTKSNPPNSEQDKANFLICNPPYSRHHHLSSDEKLRLQRCVKQGTGMKISQLSGLYCYFMLISHSWLADGGLACWLVPSEFMDVNYGRQLKEYLTTYVNLLRIHRFSPKQLQFGDALVSSSVIWFRKTKSSTNCKVEFTCGSSIKEPEKRHILSINSLRDMRKWNYLSNVAGGSNLDTVDKLASPKLSDFFQVRRGLVTGANKFFLLSPDQISEYNLPTEFLTPILPSPRYLLSDEIQADDTENPVLKHRLFLLNCSLPERIVKLNYPSLWEYLQSGIQMGIHERYLCQHRSPWYSQERRDPTLFLCTYMGRGSVKNPKPFRFILNYSKAIAANGYLMLYPSSCLKKAFHRNPELIRAAWGALKAITSQSLVNEARVYGDGLYKLEPKELANVFVGDVFSERLGLGEPFTAQQIEFL